MRIAVALFILASPIAASSVDASDFRIHRSTVHDDQRVPVTAVRRCYTGWWYTFRQNEVRPYWATRCRRVSHYAYSQR